MELSFSNKMNYQTNRKLLRHGISKTRKIKKNKRNLLNYMECRAVQKIFSSMAFLVHEEISFTLLSSSMLLKMSILRI